MVVLAEGVIDGERQVGTAEMAIAVEPNISHVVIVGPLVTEGCRSLYEPIYVE